MEVESVANSSWSFHFARFAWLLSPFA